MESFNINLENFQSIRGADLEFVPGVNLIVGQSNSGKTSILRAVRSVVDNPARGKYFIKKGTNSAEVTIKFDGNEMSWKRTPSDITYTVNGEVYKKAGRNDLFDLKNDNGFVKDDEDNIMNIEGEWDLPFPFDRTPSELFRLFENIFCISDSAVILKAFKDEEGTVVKDKIALEDKLGRLDKKVGSLEDLAKEVDTEKYTSRLEVFKENIDKYVEIATDMQKIVKGRKFSAIDLDELLPPETNTLASYVEAVKDYKFLTTVVKRQKFYKSLPASVIIGDTIDKYIQVDTDYKHVEHAKVLEDFDLSLECAVDGATLESYQEMLKDYDDLVRRSSAASFELDKVCKVGDTIEKYEELLKDFEHIQNCYSKCKQIKARYAEVEQHISETQAKLNEYKVCPLCGHELEGDKQC